MLLTIERVALLKKIEIFSETPDQILAAVARIIEEVKLGPGEEFIKEGDPGDCLYAVIEGQVRVHSGGETILILGPGKTVGELALLDPQPRSASVSTVSEVLLFRIDEEPFNEVIADRWEIAQGIIRALVRRVRELGIVPENIDNEGDRVKQ